MIWVIYSGTTDNFNFTSRLIEGDYPDYKKIIPEGLETEVRIKKEELLNSVKAANIFSRQISNSVSLSVKSKGEIEVSSPESQIGDSITVVKAEVKGKGGEITFNSRYLLDFLNTFKEEEIIFKMNDKISPGLFQGIKDKNYLYIVMPLRA